MTTGLQDCDKVRGLAHVLPFEKVFSFTPAVSQLSEKGQKKPSRMQLLPALRGQALHHRQPGVGQECDCHGTPFLLMAAPEGGMGGEERGGRGGSHQNEAGWGVQGRCGRLRAGGRVEQQASCRCRQQTEAGTAVLQQESLPPAFPLKTPHQGSASMRTQNQLPGSTT